MSFSSNITPDSKTGIGNWTEEEFISTMRLGIHAGLAREILPPMPWEDLAELSDNDLKAIFAYLKTLKPIENEVPDAIPPAGSKEPKKQ